MEYVLSLSYGKDSLACLGAIEELGWPLDRIVHAEVWATETIPADLPPMVEFKSCADKIIRERWGIEVEHVRAATTYEDVFYRRVGSGRRAGAIYGFPYRGGAWCNSRLKVAALSKAAGSGVAYVGIAADEPQRFHSLGERRKSPLVAAGWIESKCREWCEDNGLLSPIYTSGTRGGCWFCHNQSVQQLRLLRSSYPDLWQRLLVWDSDSPLKFKADGQSVCDYERRFQLEDEGLLSPDDKVFRWVMLDSDSLNYRLF